MAGLSRWLKPRSGSGGQTRTETRLAATPGDGVPAGPITLRSGVVPGGDPFALSGSGMTATVGVGRAVVQGTTAQGAYSVAFGVAQSLVIPDGNGVNPRVDLLVVRVYDPEIDGSSTATVVLERVAGTPGTSPVAPAAPAGSLALWEIPVPYNASAGNPINWSAKVDRRWYTVAAGGIQTGPDTTSGAHDAQYRDRGTSTGLERWNAGNSAWEPRLYLGTSGRLVVGSDTEWYRDAANRWRTPDSLIVDGDFSAAGIGGVVSKVKTGDTPKQSDTTLAADPDLAGVPLVANGIYAVTAIVFYSTHQDADLKVKWAAPALATMVWHGHCLPTGTTGTTGTSIYDAQSIGATYTPGGPDTSNSTVMTLLISGTLFVSSTAGQLDLTWAQNSSNFVQTFLRKGSRLDVRRLA